MANECMMCKPFLNTTGFDPDCAWHGTKAQERNTRPAAPVGGLETVGAQVFRDGAWQTVLPFSSTLHPFPVRGLVPRPQAKMIIASERAKYSDAMEKLVESQHETLVWQQRAIDLKADNAALTARVKELGAENVALKSDVAGSASIIEHLKQRADANFDKVIEEGKRAKALETQLAAAKKALEPFSKYAGTLFERNFNDPDIINQFGEYRLTAKDFFDARVASETGR